MTKIGIKASIFTLFAAIVFVAAKKMYYSKLDQKNLGKDLGSDASQYLRLINYGINPDDAFKLVSGK
jgi:hypothetical protein